MQKFKKLAITGLASAGLIIGLASPASASQVGGYAIVDDTTGIVHTQVQGEVSISSRQSVGQNTHGTLRGTWTHGSTGILGFGNVWSSVTGSSSNNNSRAQGRGTARNGQGHENSGGWRAPGVNSRGEIDRTNSGTNVAFWDLRNP